MSTPNPPMIKRPRPLPPIRKKGKIAPIDTTNRPGKVKSEISYSKRSTTVLKKAYEMAVISHTKVIVCIVSASGRIKFTCNGLKDPKNAEKWQELLIQNGFAQFDEPTGFDSDKTTE